jgi:hypothetical protein
MIMEVSEPYGSSVMAADIAYANQREQLRQEWNAAVTAHRAAPSEATVATVRRLKDRYLAVIHLHIMQADRYQERTH